MYKKHVIIHPIQNPLPWSKQWLKDTFLLNSLTHFSCCLPAFAIAILILLDPKYRGFHYSVLNPFLV